MSTFDLCEECGVPRIITTEYLWLDNGDIVQKRDQRDRIIFKESENLDPLFHGIEQLIGVHIEHIAIDCIRRTYRTYVGLFLPRNVNELVRAKQLDIKALDDQAARMGLPMGTGKFDFVDMRYEDDEDDYYTVSVTEPYSVLMTAASHCGAIEAITGRSHGVKYSKVSPDVYHQTAFPSEHPGGLRGRLKMERYAHASGDLVLERCGSCGGPKALSDFQWHLDRGVIVDKSNQHRFAVMGPNQIDPIFKELEMELGDTIPRVVVEAQRRFTKTGYYTMRDYGNMEDFRAGLALRGLGNLKELEIKRTGLKMRLENAVLPLTLVGMMQGIFDAALHSDSTVEWELSEQGSLRLEVAAVP
jgi:hypothetical protein